MASFRVRKGKTDFFKKKNSMAYINKNSNVQLLGLFSDRQANFIYKRARSSPCANLEIHILNVMNDLTKY